MTSTLQQQAINAGHRADQLITELGSENETVIVIEGKAFKVRKMKLKPFVALFSLLTQELHTLAQKGLLTGNFIGRLMNIGENLFKVETSGDNDIVKQLVELLSSLGETLPEFVQHILALMLGAKSKEESDYIYDNVDFDQLAPIIEAWMTYNPWRDIVDRLFQVGREMLGEVQQKQKNPITPSESSMNLQLVDTDQIPAIP
jgi:hypothetical protein